MKKEQVWIILSRFSCVKLPFLALGYVVGQCQGQSFSGFNSSCEVALCHGIVIFSLKMVILINSGS